jgi:hypothetical protein
VTPGCCRSECLRSTAGMQLNDKWFPRSVKRSVGRTVRTGSAIGSALDADLPSMVVALSTCAD